ncbi:MAG: PDZ domain-containing protein [Anaerolineae bacterium]|nr:PDZ domain-containing protein [Phycisphaerae bacterium]
MKRGRRFLAILALSGASLAAWFGVNSLVHDVQFARAAQEVETNRAQLANIQELSNVYRQVAKVVGPSVVKIDVRKTIRGGRRLQSMIPPNMRGFVPENGSDGNGNGEDDITPSPEDDLQQIGEGSGVIMETDGSTAYILTNNHVAGGATDIRVTLADGREIDDAKVIGADPKSDLAVVRIQADRLIPARWGNSDYLEKGDLILAFGSPFGYVGSMTHGIVSALNRESVGIQGSNIAYENFIQVDAPINPGNSGGPLVNLKGEVVGINTAIASRTGTFNGIGFAIPVKMAKPVYEQLKAKGKVVRGWLGVEIHGVGEAEFRDEAKSTGYTGEKGVIVSRVLSGAPSAGKLQPSDIITHINGKDVESRSQLRNEIAMIPPGTEVKLTVFRDGKTIEVPVKIGEQPSDLLARAIPNGAPERPANDGTASAENLGVQLATVNDELLERFGLANTPGLKGALITNVQQSSPAAQAGIRPGDVITRIGSERVTNAQSAATALAKQDLTKGMRVFVTNKDGERFVFVKQKS